MKYQEGMSALAEAQRIEGEEAKRIDTINQQLNTLKIKEKEMTEVFNSGLCNTRITYSEIPLLRPPKIKTSCLLKTLFTKFKLFFSSFFTPIAPLIRDHLWDCPKVVFKTTFGQSQRWS